MLPFLKNLNCLSNLLYHIVWFCHTLTWIRHGCTWVPHPEPPFQLPPHPIPLCHPSAPAPSILYHASNLDWWFISHMIIYMFQCHSPISPSPSPSEAKRLFNTSVSLLLSRIQGYHYHLSIFHIYALVNCIGIFFFWLMSTFVLLNSIRINFRFSLLKWEGLGHIIGTPAHLELERKSLWPSLPPSLMTLSQED